MNTPHNIDSYVTDRFRMVQYQLVSRDIHDERVIWAMSEVPRHLFVPELYRHAAYEDCPLPIGEGQTISQPYMVAIMTQCLELKGGEQVLEIGTGSGYQAAIVSKLPKFTKTDPECNRFIINTYLRIRHILHPAAWAASFSFPVSCQQ